MTDKENLEQAFAIDIMILVTPTALFIKKNYYKLRRITILWISWFTTDWALKLMRV
jgi:hypothetical protein